MEREKKPFEPPVPEFKGERYYYEDKEYYSYRRNQPHFPDKLELLPFDAFGNPESAEGTKEKFQSLPKNWEGVL